MFFRGNVAYYTQFFEPKNLHYLHDISNSHAVLRTAWVFFSQGFYTNYKSVVVFFCGLYIFTVRRGECNLPLHFHCPSGQIAFALTFSLSVGANCIRPYIFTVRRGKLHLPLHFYCPSGQIAFALTFSLSVGANCICPYIFTVRRGELHSPLPAFALYYITQIAR